jgi:Tol biopolymer transport system component
MIFPTDSRAMVHYEETEYRAKPVWTPDGKSLVYVSDEADRVVGMVRDRVEGVLAR